MWQCALCGGWVWWGVNHACVPLQYATGGNVSIVGNLRGVRCRVCRALLATAYQPDDTGGMVLMVEPHICTGGGL